jgi:hypothetical protein
LEQGCVAIDTLIQLEEIWKGELADGLERYVRETFSVVKQREAIVRACIGEARFLAESTRCSLEEFMLTRKARLVAALQEAQKRGLVRMDVDLSAAADLIRDSIHSTMRRHTLYRSDPEAIDAHLRGFTDIFYRGIKANDGSGS